MTTSALETALLLPSAFRPAGDIDRDVPAAPGLYAIRIREPALLPAPFSGHLSGRNGDLLYLGITTKATLRTRLLEEELRGRRHGTFFRSIGAVLGHRPVPGSLSGRVNQRNYTFDRKSKTAIVAWLNLNVSVNWVAFVGDSKSMEAELIRNHRPLLNLAMNPDALPELDALRTECRLIASELNQGSG